MDAHDTIWRGGFIYSRCAGRAQLYRPCVSHGEVLSNVDIGRGSSSGVGGGGCLCSFARQAARGRRVDVQHPWRGHDGTDGRAHHRLWAGGRGSGAQRARACPHPPLGGSRQVLRGVSADLCPGDRNPGLIAVGHDNEILPGRSGSFPMLGTCRTPPSVENICVICAKMSSSPLHTVQKCLFWRRIFGKNGSQPSVILSCDPLFSYTSPDRSSFLTSF